MNKNVTALPTAKGSITTKKVKQIKRPCDYGLDLAVMNLEEQLGTIEAYNRLVIKAEALKNKINKGDAVKQNPLYATDIQSV